MDRQFKHKGNLIEPMEVERALAAYPGISFVFVMKRNLDREVLVAYINWIRKGDMEDHSPSLHFEKNDYKENNLVNQIKQYLSTLLPKWMIPERFVFLEKIPLNANEKLDVKSLPAQSICHFIKNQFHKKRLHFVRFLRKYFRFIRLELRTTFFYWVEILFR